MAGENIVVIDTLADAGGSDALKLYGSDEYISWSEVLTKRIVIDMTLTKAPGYNYLFDNRNSVGGASRIYHTDYNTWFVGAGLTLLVNGVSKANGSTVDTFDQNAVYEIILDNPQPTSTLFCNKTFCKITLPKWCIIFVQAV